MTNSGGSLFDRWGEFFIGSWKHQGVLYGTTFTLALVYALISDFVLHKEAFAVIGGIAGVVVILLVTLPFLFLPIADLLGSALLERKRRKILKLRMLSMEGRSLDPTQPEEETFEEAVLWNPLRSPERYKEYLEAERRLHIDARRFARILVSEVKLYNEEKVKAGLTSSNLYAKLKDDINEAKVRAMYEKLQHEKGASKAFGRDYQEGWIYFMILLVMYLVENGVDVDGVAKELLAASPHSKNLR